LTTTFRRRVDNAVLRWQGRLDSETTDRFAPLLAFAGLFVVMALMSLAQARSLEGNTDLAAYTQAAWLIRHGHDPIATVGSGANIFAQQGTFIFYPLALLSGAIPAIPLLLTVQSAALALAGIPLWRVARKLAGLRAGAALIVLLVYAVHPIVQTLNLDGFHPETLALPFLLAAAYFGLSQHWRRFALCCVIVMLCRADLGIAVAGLGGLLIAQGHRRRGVIAIAVGLVWAFGFLFVVQPHIGHVGITQLDAYSAYGDTPLSVAWGMLTHPLQVLGDVFSRANFQLMVYLFAPVLFLPFLSPRYLLPAVPLEVLYLAGQVPQVTRYGPQAVAITAFIFLATPMGLARLGRRNEEKVTVDRRVLITLVLACTSFYVLIAPSTPYQRPWDWGGRDAVDGARLAARDSISRSASVRASPSMLIVLAQRKTLYQLTNREVSTGPPGAREAAKDVDVVVLDRHDLDRADQAEADDFIADLEEQGFEAASNNLGIVVFRRR
jgi:uncharacterized membrane protein